MEGGSEGDSATLLKGRSSSATDSWENSLASSDCGKSLERADSDTSWEVRRGVTAVRSLLVST